MRILTLAAAAAVLMLGACDRLGIGGMGGGQPALPPVQQGATAPTKMAAAPAGVQRARIDENTRTQLTQNITQLLDGYQQNYTTGMAKIDGVNDEIAALEPMGDHRWVLPLTANTQYTFLGACDGDCHNVDIELIDMRTGGVVASDMLPDDYPVVNFKPTADGQYMARLLLQNCTVAPCYTGMRALSEAPGQAPTNKG
ncbi:hypothetical protein [Terricaulis sp.]|uniref:hypothetical protein n=1 Tax=Terricaulis sp. TaxID=2768686 RepID=UPI00378309E6